MNSVKLSGTLDTDPKVEFLESGKAKCSFSVSLVQGKDKYSREHCFDCQAWGSVGEMIGEKYKAGSVIEIAHGILNEERWSDKSTGETRRRIVVVVFDVKPAPTETGGVGGPDYDDVPF